MTTMTMNRAMNHAMNTKTMTFVVDDWESLVPSSDVHVWDLDYQIKETKTKITYREPTIRPPGYYQQLQRLAKKQEEDKRYQLDLEHEKAVKAKEAYAHQLKILSKPKPTPAPEPVKKSKPTYKPSTYKPSNMSRKEELDEYRKIRAAAKTGAKSKASVGWSSVSQAEEDRLRYGLENDGDYKDRLRAKWAKEKEDRRNKMLASKNFVSKVTGGIEVYKPTKKPIKKPEPEPEVVKPEPKEDITQEELEDILFLAKLQKATSEVDKIFTPVQKVQVQKVQVQKETVETVQTEPKSGWVQVLKTPNRKTKPTMKAPVKPPQNSCPHHSHPPRPRRESRRLCKYYKRCSKGESCPFAHTLENATLCSYDTRCTRADCKFKHTKDTIDSLYSRCYP